MIEIVLLIVVILSVIFLIYQNLKKNETKTNNVDEITKIATISEGIEDLKMIEKYMLWLFIIMYLINIRILFNL